MVRRSQRRLCDRCGFRVAASICSALVATPVLLAAEAEEKLPIERLDGPTRAKVLAALAGLIILGFAMVILAWLAMRAARRHVRSSFERPKRSKYAEFGVDDWASKPLIETDDTTDDER